jgi:Tol biopolymer transport system component
MRRLAFIHLAVILAAISPLPNQKGSYGRAELDGRERITYVSFRPGNWDLYYFDRLGALPRNLTDNFGLDYDAQFSSDGQYIVFCSERRGNPDLYVLDLKNGGSPRLLIDSEAMEDQPSIAPDNKTLAFVSTRDGNAEIFTIPFRPNQTQTIETAVNLTKNPGGDFRPAFSPDGKEIAFSTDRDTPPTGEPARRRREGEIYRMGSDGGNVRRLTHSPDWDGSPAWSHDGQTIYFYSIRDKIPRIWAMRADGDSPRPISGAEEYAMSPAVMPDGRVAYTITYGPADNIRWKIMSVKPDGTDERDESDTVNDYWGPAFNPKTGAMLCYGTGPVEKDTPAGSSYPGRLYLGPGPLLTRDAQVTIGLPDRQVDLYPIRGFSAAPHPTRNSMVRTELPGPRLILSDLRGHHEKEITKINQDQLPWIGLNWSHDGNWIVYTVGKMFSPAAAETDIWKIRPDGSGSVNLTPNSPGNDGFPSFSGDGRRLVWRSGRTGNFDIFVMNSDGTGIRNLTNNPANDTFPAFSPLNNEVVFASDRDGRLDEKAGYRTFDLYTLQIKPDNAPGALRRLTQTPVQNAHPQYSPDGKWLIFTSERGGINDEEPLLQLLLFCPQIYGDLYAYRFSDGKLIRLTHNKWEDGFANWVGPAR